MNLQDCLRAFRRRWVTILIVLVTTLLATVATTLLMTPRYSATARMFFAVQGGESVTDLAQGSNFAEKQMTSYIEVATSPLVLAPVISQLKLDLTIDQLANSITATVPANTVILELQATATDRQRAADTANAVAAQMSKVITALSPPRSDGTEPVRSTILAEARVPENAATPNLLLNLGLGSVLGLLLGVLVAVVRHAMETQIRSEEDLATVTSKSLLGVIPFDESAPAKPVAMHDAPLGARSEAIRRLRTNLQFVDLADGAKSLVVSSSIPGEGKSTTATNLAVSLADAGLRVLLVDADLRRPSIARYLGIEGAVGLTTVLIGQAELEDVVQPWGTTTLDILPAGQIPPNPSELLGSKAMSSLVEQLVQSYDMVLLDSSPLLPVTDAAILSKVVGGILLVVGADRVHRAQLRHSLESLTAVGAKVSGLVLNKVARRNASTYSYYHDYAPIEAPATSSDAGEREAVTRTSPGDAQVDQAQDAEQRLADARQW